MSGTMIQYQNQNQTLPITQQPTPDSSASESDHEIDQDVIMTDTSPLSSYPADILELPGKCMLELDGSGLPFSADSIQHSGPGCPCEGRESEVYMNYLVGWQTGIAATQNIDQQAATGIVLHLISSWQLGIPAYLEPMIAQWRDSIRIERGDSKSPDAKSDCSK